MAADTVKQSINEEVSCDLGIPVETIELVHEFYLQNTKRVLELGTFDVVRLPYFGKFGVLTQRLIRLNKRTHAIHGAKR